MTDPAETKPVLHLAGVYDRRVNASLGRIWENVFDWEHLAHLHNGSFAACLLKARGSWGWRAEIVLAGGDASSPQLIELKADRPAGRYVTTTLKGTGEGSEIRVALKPLDDQTTDVRVEFHLPESDPAMLAMLGQAYSAAYAQLWDEDETMMQGREQALALLADQQASTHDHLVDLGSHASVRAALPMRFEFNGQPFRLFEINGELAAHAALCPHWLGPLDEAPIIDNVVRCPWHAYRFDVRTGACLNATCKPLPKAPVISLIKGRIVASA